MRREGSGSTNESMVEDMDIIPIYGIGNVDIDAEAVAEVEGNFLWLKAP